MAKQELVDRAGNKVAHLLRDSAGAISVNDKTQLNKFIMEQANQRRLVGLENDILEIKLLLKELLKNG